MPDLGLRNRLRYQKTSLGTSIGHTTHLEFQGLLVVSVANPSLESTEGSDLLAFLPLTYYHPPKTMYAHAQMIICKLDSKGFIIRVKRCSPFL
ncbi:hypothetical protein IG631_14868 [Alternaria alternata]|nr:hypothetical protein IG631_14868 [Alternaria alternata]